jgi:hypothetical protein
MKRLFIYHYLGLGDHVICNGLVRHHSEKEQVSLFCTDQTFKNISFMYRDNKNIKLIPIKTIGESDHHPKYGRKLAKKKITEFLKNNKHLNFKIIPKNPIYLKILFSKNIFLKKNRLSFDQLYYYLDGVDFKIRFDKFYIERDLKTEERIYKLLNPQNEPYIYVHDDEEANFIIDKNKHRNDLKIIKNLPSEIIFNLRKILENATEIHTMQTGMFDFCNSIKLNCPIFLHTYVRKYPNKKWISKGLNKIKIIK